MIFTLIAYKPDGEDTCRGVSLARYSSDFQIFTRISIGSIANIWGSMMWKNQSNTNLGDCDYEFTLLLDGLSEEYEDSCEDNGDLYEANHELRKTVLKEATAVQIQHRAAAEEAKEKALQKAAAARAAASKLKQIKSHDNEREQYLRLKAKFENND